MQGDDNWAAYYRQLGGREPRDLFQQLMTLSATPSSATPGLAIDLGCGDGTETLALLSAGWRVLAVDQSAGAIRRVTDGARLAGAADRLQTQQAAFVDAVLPPADLLYAGLSLPFCRPADLPQVWSAIRHALRPGAWLAAHFFGRRDSWASNPDMTFHTAEALRALFAGLTVEHWREVEDDRPSAFEVMKHFHYFEVIARQPDGH